MLIENEPEHLADLPSGEIPAAEQPKTLHYIRCSLTRPCYVVLVACLVWRTGYYVIIAVSGRMSPGTWKHHHDAPCTWRDPLCWHCDNLLRDQQSSALESSPWRTVPLTSSQRFAVNWGLMIPTH
jgi:hypothetical protein